jgi:hypothetical protein
MERLFQSFWLGLGDASEGCGSSSLLVVGGSPPKCCGLEDGAALYYVVPLGGKE